MPTTRTGKIDKSWGYEIVWASNDSYCGKILFFEKKGSSTTTQIHKHKRKSWFINAGKFRITFINVKTGKTEQAILEEGKTVDIAEMSPHSVESLVPGSIIFEVGTVDNVDDQFKLSPDDAVQTSVEELK